MQEAMVEPIVGKIPVMANGAEAVQPAPNLGAEADQNWSLTSLRENLISSGESRLKSPPCGRPSSSGSRMLRCKKLIKRFGAVTACSDVSISIERGMITGLIGPNGAGKSTLINMLGGQWAPASGTIEVDGEPITRWNIYKRARRARISRTFQTPRIFPSLSVRENIDIGQHRTIFGRSDRSDDAANDGKDAGTVLLERFGLLDEADKPAGNLAHGARRWVELGRCLRSYPSYLLFDEPTAGLSPAEVE